MNAGSRHRFVFLLLLIFNVAALIGGLFVGGVDLPADKIAGVFVNAGDSDAITRFVILENRLPALLTALLSGAALAVAGLLMQTCFNNPLAGPSIMGISGGSSLGVAFVMLTMGGTLGLWGKIAIVGGAAAGAFVVMCILAFFSTMVKSADVLLIVGILIGYLSSSAITLLNFFSTDSAVHGFVLWGMGNFSTVSLGDIPLFAILCIVSLSASFLYLKSLNAMLFGENYSRNVGIDINKVRTGMLVLSGILTAVVTAWCGPVGFIGLVSPHIARLIMQSSNHRTVLPCTLLCGSAMALLCQIISVAPSLSTGALIPLNAITPVIGVPVIIYVLFNRKKLLYFN